MYTVGYDPGTGKQIQKSITGKTQSEVAKKLKEMIAALDTGTYITPNKTTVAQWRDTYGHVTEQMKTESAYRMFSTSLSAYKGKRKPLLKIWKNPNFKSGE